MCLYDILSRSALASVKSLAQHKRGRIYTFVFRICRARARNDDNNSDSIERSCVLAHMRTMECNAFYKIVWLQSTVRKIIASMHSGDILDKLCGSAKANKEVHHATGTGCRFCRWQKLARNDTKIKSLAALGWDAPQSLMRFFLVHA